MNDANFLATGLAPFEGNPEGVSFDPPVRDKRLADLAGIFLHRVVVFVDDVQIPLEKAEYIPPRPMTATDDFTPTATYRVRGRLPAHGRVLRWFYGLVIDPYPLVIQYPDGGSTTVAIEGQVWSGPIDLERALRQPSRVAQMRAQLAHGFGQVLPRGV